MSHAFAFLVDAGNGDAIVVANWNTRPLEDAANARAEAAEAQVAALQTALAAAEEDAEKLADECAFYEEGIGLRCIHCGGTARDGYALSHAADCPITLHRARVGGGK